MDQLENGSERIRSTEDIQRSIDELLEKMKAMESESAARRDASAAVIEKNKLSERSMTMMLFSTVISIILVSALLVTTTWAWFTESVTASDNSITSAYCTVDAIVDESGTAVVPTSSSDALTYELSGGVEYTVTVTVSGIGKGGYMKLYYGSDSGEASYTEVVLSDTYVSRTAENDTNSISFTLSLEEAGTVILKSSWGDHGRDDPEIISGGSYTINKDGVLSEI